MIKQIHKIRRFLPSAPWPIPGSSLEGCHGHDASDATTASRAQFGDLQLCTETQRLSRGTPNLGGVKLIFWWRSAPKGTKLSLITTPKLPK